jgi:hypothetical protein
MSIRRKRKQARGLERWEMMSKLAETKARQRFRVVGNDEQLGRNGSKAEVWRNRK